MPPILRLPVTAAHSSASKTSSTDVSTRNSTSVGRQAGQQLAHQEVADGAIRAGERIQELLRSDAPLQRDRRQLRAGRPSLGELVQAAQLIPGQADVVQCEERGHLAWSEAEIVATQLEQIAAQTQPGQRQWRIRPGSGGEAEAVG